MTTPVGIDPASGKETCIWYKNGFKFVKAQDVRSELISIMEQEKGCLFSWDSPLSFSRKSLTDRTVDKVCRAWVKTEIELNSFKKKSISAMPFCGLSHWVISCEALGMPFGRKIEGLNLLSHSSGLKEFRNYVVEVHPAVAMGCLWLDAKIDQPFPVYKKSKLARQQIVDYLSFPEVCIENDDILDAYVAFLMADGFLHSRAGFISRPEDGSYVLPYGESFDRIFNKIELNAMQ